MKRQLFRVIRDLANFFQNKITERKQDGTYAFQPPASMPRQSPADHTAAFYAFGRYSPAASRKGSPCFPYAFGDLIIADRRTLPESGWRPGGRRPPAGRSGAAPTSRV